MASENPQENFPDETYMQQKTLVVGVLRFFRHRSNYFMEQLHMFWSRDFTNKISRTSLKLQEWMSHSVY